LAGQFAFIYMPCNTYSTLDAPGRARLLAGLRARLLPGGLFAASLPNPVALAALEDSEPEEEETFAHPGTGNPVQVSAGWARRSGELAVIWHYDHLLPDGRVARHSVEVRHQPQTPGQIRAELEGQGFEVILRGDFDSSAYSPDSPHLILEAS
jgi:hypothetical protein